GRRLGQLAPPVADVDVPELREAVEVLLAVGVANDASLAADEHERSRGGLRGVVQRVDEMGSIEREHLVDGEFGHTVLRVRVGSRCNVTPGRLCRSGTT